jgi:hypothetical protein
MTSCQGEMALKSFEVKGIDQNGEIVIDQTVNTLRNGFMELWLPREREISLLIKYSKVAAKGIIETFDNSPTCITTFQLK